uniref:Uncharacterized protein n=1 Tax=uncultured bacterium contig00046 TaxID=1181532 RepID=A0A806KG23_9BACT|nr:hypothetical protein [uncultured bacterium contig00046]
MAISSMSELLKKPAISADLMYQYYDNKAITPQIRAALQKRDEAEAAKESGYESASSSESKFGPATRVNITDQMVRMNITNNTTKYREEKEAEQAEKAGKKKYFDPLAEVKKNVAERESAARAEKDARLKEIADKVAADEESKNQAEEGT